jgi:hypothetical protein
MEFVVDKSKKTVVITAEFAAERDWCGKRIPNRNFSTNGGHQSPTRREPRLMDFREGGRRFYAMVKP